MTTATAGVPWQLEWEASVVAGRLGQLDLVFGEIRNRHAHAATIERIIAGAADPDEAGEAIDQVVHDAFHAGFAAAGVVDRVGWPSRSVGYEPVLQAIVNEAGIDQIPGHIEDRRFVPDAEAGA
ncbi:MAG: hypothetical protein EPO00_10580 [Chloroflexota bacterium]|nr:MAG: hypothetical protein EPO00_10580 [Chloroflexota bacterium]